MAKHKTTKRNGPGRPRQDLGQILYLRLDSATLADVRKLAKSEDRTIQHTLRRLIRAALDAKAA